MSFKLPKHELTAELELFIRLTEKDSIIEPKDHIHTNISIASAKKKPKHNKNTKSSTKQLLHIQAAQNLTTQIIPTIKNSKANKLKIFTHLILLTKKKKLLLNLVLKTLITFLKIWSEEKVLYLNNITNILHLQYPQIISNNQHQTIQQKLILQTMQVFFSKIYVLRKKHLSNVKKIARNFWYHLLKYRKRMKKNLSRIYNLKNLNSYKKTRKSFVFINLNSLG